MSIASSEKDPSMIHESRLGTEKELNYRVALEEYIKNSMGSNVDKMQNFSKYVPRQLLTRFISKYELFKKVLHVQGSIVECGVFLGGGLMTWAQLSAIFEPVNHQRKIIGFDTFSGFEELSEEDKTGKSLFSQKGGLAADSYEDLKKCIKIYDANRFINHIEKVKLVKGDVKVSMPKYLQDNLHTVVSLLYLDFDVFEPTKVAIENLLPRMPKGAIIAFDELNVDGWPGEVLAVLKTIGINNLRIQRFPFDSLLSYAVIE
ncbi:MAG: TylF/MycF/NovP-related O-methyltransferase [Candidatus Margulisiibacteriota bacterium]